MELLASVPLVGESPALWALGWRLCSSHEEDRSRRAILDGKSIHFFLPTHILVMNYMVDFSVSLSRSSVGVGVIT